MNLSYDLKNFLALSCKNAIKERVDIKKKIYLSYLQAMQMHIKTVKEFFGGTNWNSGEFNPHDAISATAIVNADVQRMFSDPRYFVLKVPKGSGDADVTLGNFETD